MPGRSFLMSITLPFLSTQEVLLFAHSADPAHHMKVNSQICGKNDLTNFPLDNQERD